MTDQNAYLSQNAIFQSTLVRANGGTGGATIDAQNGQPISAVSGMKIEAKPWYSDQILPFDITLAGTSETGAATAMKIYYGVEILNEGSGVSIDDAVTEMRAKFVVRLVETVARLGGYFGGDKNWPHAGEAGRSAGCRHCPVSGASRTAIPPEKRAGRPPWSGPLMRKIGAGPVAHFWGTRVLFGVVRVVAQDGCWCCLQVGRWRLGLLSAAAVVNGADGSESEGDRSREVRGMAGDADKKMRMKTKKMKLIARRPRLFPEKDYLSDTGMG